MKYIISLIFASLAFMVTAQAQQDFHCGTEMPDEMMEWLDNYKQQNPGAPAAYKNNEPYYVPLKLHIVGTDGGAGYLKTEYILDLMCRVNEQFEETGFHYYIYDGLNYINSTDLHNHSGNQFYITIQQEKVANTANLFFVKTTSGGGSVGGGGTTVTAGYFSGFGDYIALVNNFVGPGQSTTAHELGHYFDLPHTFSGWENGNTPSNPERVDGSNCSTSGDRFCDTAPDYLGYPWQCPYNDNITDPTGALIRPDSSLYMSYEGDDCKDRFSAEQMDVMRNYLIDRRTSLLGHPKPLIADVEPTELLFPAEGATGVPSNYVQLKWKKSEGATHYHVFISRYINPNLSSAEYIIEDTSIFLTDLDPGNNYRWKVRPFNPANTCTGYTSLGSFSTVDSTELGITVDVDGLDCPDGTDGYINVSVTGGTTPYSYKWSNQGTNMNFQNNLLPGPYTITVSDLAKDSVVLYVDLIAPQPITIDLDNNDGFTLYSNVSGGTPPYAYQWSTGVSGQDEIALGSAGSYTLEIWDQNGCYSTKTFVFTNVEETELINDLAIYPNPINSGQALSINLAAKEHMDGVVELYDNSGKLVKSVQANFAAGANTLKMDMNHLQAGVYIVKIYSERFAVNRKVVVF